MTGDCAVATMIQNTQTEVDWFRTGRELHGFHVNKNACKRTFIGNHSLVVLNVASFCRSRDWYPAITISLNYY